MHINLIDIIKINAKSVHLLVYFTYETLFLFSMMPSPIKPVSNLLLTIHAKIQSVAELNSFFHYYFPHYR